MRHNSYQKNTLTAFAMMAAIVFTSTSHAALINYSQDFELLNRVDAAALGNDGWFISDNVSAPNNGPGFSTITSGQGAQQLTVFSDYMNADHVAGNWVKTMVYQEQTISITDVGSTWNFTFDVKQGDQMFDSSSNAFLKTTTSESTLNTTNFGSDWGTLTLSLEIDNSLVGQLLQFGFSTTATSYTPSGMLYDNINFSSTSAVPVPAAIWLFTSGIIGMAGLVGRKNMRANA